MNLFCSNQLKLFTQIPAELTCSLLMKALCWSVSPLKRPLNLCCPESVYEKNHIQGLGINHVICEDSITLAHNFPLPHFLTSDLCYGRLAASSNSRQNANRDVILFFLLPAPPFFLHWPLGSLAVGRRPGQPFSAEANLPCCIFWDRWGSTSHQRCSGDLETHSTLSPVDRRKKHRQRLQWALSLF